MGTRMRHRTHAGLYLLHAGVLHLIRGDFVALPVTGISTRYQGPTVIGVDGSVVLFTL